MGVFNTESYLKALKAGRSFVSNGPMLEFEVDGRGPGGVVSVDGGAVNWVLGVHSALPFESVEIFVNGVVVETVDGNAEAGSKTYQGSVDVPVGGWITARVKGENSGWPALDSYLFAETGPVWFGGVGSTDPVVNKATAEELLKVLDVAEEGLKEGYGNAEIPGLLGWFGEARDKLAGFVD